VQGEFGAGGVEREGEVLGNQRVAGASGHDQARTVGGDPKFRSSTLVFASPRASAGRRINHLSSRDVLIGISYVVSRRGV